MDWETSPRHKIYGRWYWNSRKANTSDWTYETGKGLHSSGTTRVNKAVGLDWVWTMNHTTVLNVTGSYNRFIEYAGETGLYRYKPSDVGRPIISISGPETTRACRGWISTSSRT